MSITRVTTESGVIELAQGLLGATRTQPWCVVSIPVGRTEPLVRVDDLADQVGDVCRIFVIETGHFSRQLDALLPARCQVYGGAARVYPVDPAWMHTPELSPLRFLHRPADADAVTARLAADGLSMANSAGLFAGIAPFAVLARGRVKALLAGDTRALVALDGGEYATISQELTFPDIPLGWVVSEGQQVEGMFDPQTKRLALNLTRPTPAGLLERYPHGTVTLGLVQSVLRQSAIIAIHPAVPISVNRSDVSTNPHDRVDILLDAGDVVPVRVIRDERGRTALRLHGIADDDEVEPALPLLPESAPWLLPLRDLVPEGDVEPHLSAESYEPHETLAPGHPKPGPGPHAATQLELTGEQSRGALQTAQLSLDQARARIRSLENALREAGGEHVQHLLQALRLELGEVKSANAQLRDRLRTVQADQREQRALLRKARRRESATATAKDRPRFATGDEWMIHEIYLAWLDRVEPEDRVHWPLPPRYGLGERFVASFEALDDTSRSKALKACADVLTGLAREVRARRAHPLREGNGAEDADVVRSSDGARCMRVAIEQNVPSARRLHYWQRSDGTVELSRIVLHDDMEP